MRCNYCGFDNLARHKYCGMCGKLLAAMSPTPNAQNFGTELERFKSLLVRLSAATGFTQTQLAIVAVLGITVLLVFVCGGCLVLQMFAR